MGRSRLREKLIDQGELYRLVDWAVFLVANLLNLIMVIVFLDRARGGTHRGIVGLIWVGLILTLAIVVLLNFRERRPW